MSDPITLHILGIPAPQGSKRHVGRGVMVESSKAVKPWRESVHWQAREQYQGPLLDGPLVGEVMFVMPRPQRLKQRIDVPCDRTPDLSKLLRSTEDALTGVVWVDDARVCLYTSLGKRYANPGEPTGCTITVREAV